MAGATITASVEEILKLCRSDEEFACPHCGHVHDAHDCDALPQIISYWGDEPHDFTCWECGKDFIVHERVTRKFETEAK